MQYTLFGIFITINHSFFKYRYYLIIDRRNYAVIRKETLIFFKTVDQYLHNFSDKMYLARSNIHNEE